MKAKKVWLAYLFFFLLGGFGAHKFYLKKPAMGILYLYLYMFCQTYAQTDLLDEVMAMVYISGLTLLIISLMDLFTLRKQVEELNASAQEQQNN